MMLLICLLAIMAVAFTMLRGLSRGLHGMAAVVLMTSVAGARAEEQDLTALSIEELLRVEVISASRLGQQSNQAPTAISVLTASDIRTFGWRTLAEALNAIRGLNSSSDRLSNFLTVRGFLHSSDYNSRVLVMIDGQRMNENVFDSAHIGHDFLLDIDMIERIEFVPGSGASIYGANAFLGLINVVTKKGGAINGAQLAGEYGTFDTYKGRVTYGKQFDNGADVLVSASHYDSAGVENLYFPEFDTPATNNGIAHNMDVERSDRLFGRVQFEDFTFTGGFVDRLRRMPAAQFTAIFNDPATHSYDRAAFGNLKYEHKLSEDTSLQLRGFYQAYNYSVDVANNLLGPNISTNESTGRWWGGEAQLTTTLFDNHRVMVGMEYQYDQEQRLLQYMVDPYFMLHDSNRHGHRLELYAQDDIRLLEDLTFSAGLRLDYHHMLKQLQLNPRLGLIWNPLESTTFKLLYSSTFRAPNAWERDFEIPMFVFKANPNNYEEQIKSYEAIAEWHSSAGLKLVADFFYNDISQLLQQAVVPGLGASGSFANLGQYHAYGFELEAEQRWDSGRLLKSSYAYNQVTDEANAGVWADGSPRNVFKLHYAEPLFDGFAKLGIENIFVDERRTPQGGMADAYYQLNLNLTSDRLLNGLDVSFGVYNVLDNHYQMLGGTGFADLAPNVIPMNGREFRLKLQLTF